MRKYLLLVILTITSLSLFSQDFSNKGKDFWVGYGYHAVMTPGGGAQEMVLYFATDQATNIQITIPGIGYVQNISTGAAPTVTTSSPIPKGTAGAALMTEGVLNKGIHITSDKPMVAYAHIYNASVSGATILFPTPTLGKEYYSVNYTNISNSANANCWMYVVAADPGTTTVEITPSASTIGGWSAGTTYTVTLNQGEIYNVMATFDNSALKGGDLSGTLVKSISSGSGGCKRIGVFSGSGRISITCNGANSSSDNYMVQTFPKSAWGQKYLTASTAGSMSNNIYRVCVQDPTTVVKINGLTTLLPLVNNFYYELPVTSAPQMIEADKPVMVAQYVTSQGACANGTPGDPEVIYLSPVEQNIDKVIWNATANFAISQQFFNVVIPNKGTGISSFRLIDQFNNVLPTSPFIIHPQDNNYSYLRQTLPGSGVYRIQSDSGFNAIAYGFGSAESYGYNAGTNIKDLYQQTGVSTTYGIEPGNIACIGTSFRFKMSLPYAADSIDWYLGVLPPATTPSVPPPGGYVRTMGPADSINVINGKNIYWYSIPINYSVPTAGTYTIPIIAYNSSNPNGCGVEQELEFILEIAALPAAAFNITTLGGCVAETFHFADNTTSVKPTYTWWWDFGDPGSGGNNNSLLETPQHLFTTPGPHTIRFAAITTPGCLTDTISQVINVPDFPEATITGNATVCINSAPVPVTFAGTKGTPEYDFSYTIDNGGGPGPTQVITSIGSNVTFNHIPSVAGTFTYTLTSVKNKGSGLCVTNYPVAPGTQITIVVQPDATTTLTSAPATANQTVCINNAIATITYAIGGSGTGATITGLPTGVTGVYAGGVVTITGTPTTTVPGPYIYTVTPIGPCLKPAVTGQILVQQDATVALTSAPPTTSQTICINTPLTMITYSVAGGGTGGNVTGLPAGVNGVYAGGVVTITGTPTATGHFTYTVNGTGPCLPASLGGTIDVTADATTTLTSAPATANQIVCINNAIATITYAIGGSGTGATITGLPTGVNGVYAAGVVTITGTPTTTVPGPYIYTVTPIGPCQKPALTGQILVQQDATVSLTSAPPTTSQTICINTPLTMITYSVAGGGTGGNVTGLPAGVNGVYAGGVVTITGTPTATGHFTYTVNGTGPCLPASLGGTIDVTADATTTLTSAPATANQTVCINNAITTITYAIGGSGTGATITGLPTGVTGVYAAGVVTITGTPTTTVPGPHIYTVTPIGPCQKPALTGQITINQDGIINQTSAPATANQEICKNTALTPITFTISGGGTGASISPALPTGVTGTYAGGVFTINGTPTVAVMIPTIYTITTTGGFCVQNSRTVTLTVNELPTADFTYSTPNCRTYGITFNDASVPNSGALDQYNWAFGDATFGTGTPVTHAYATAGIKNVTLTVRTDKGCFSTPITHAVTVSENPNADFTVPEACISDNVIFPDISAAPAGNPLTRWEWNFDDPGSGASNVQVYTTPGPGTHLFSTTGIHNVRLVVTTSTGCTDTTYHNIDINGVPTSSYNLSNTTNQCSSDTVFLTNTSTVSYGNIIRQEIYWDNVGAPGTFIAEPSPAVGNVYKHKYPTLQTTQTYDIKVRSYSGTTCFDDEIITLTVYATPKVQFNNMPDACYDAAPFQITQASEIGGVPGAATYTGPGVSPTGIFSPMVAGIGTHTIKYTFTAAASGCIDTLSKTIRVRDTASANFTPAAIRCEKSAIQFSSASSTIPAGEGTITGWSWNFGDPGSGANNTSNAANPAHTYAAYGLYTVTLTVETSNGCFSTQRSMQVQVDPLPAPGFAFDKPSYCIPNAIVTFSNSSTIPSSSPMTYTWDFGDLTNGSGPTPSHHYTGIGPFNVVMTATSAENCSNSITIPLTTIHPQPKADYATSKPAVCIGDAVTFTDLSDGKDGIINEWHWSFGDAQTATTNPVTHLYAAAQDYNVSLYTVNTQGCNSDTITRVFTVDPFPVVNAGPDRFLLEGGQITLEPTVTGAHLEFLWTPNVSMSNNRVENPVVRNLTGDITYKLTVTAKGGCTASDEVFVKLLRAPKIPNTFTPNNDGINDTWRIDYLNTYPNNRVQIFTRTGQKVFESRGYTKPWDGTLNGKPLPIDTYYYIIEPNNGRDPITGYVTILK